MENQNNQLFLLRLLRTRSSSKQQLSKKYWCAIYSLTYTFNVLVDRRDPQQPWPLQSCCTGLQTQYVCSQRRCSGFKRIICDVISFLKKIHNNGSQILPYRRSEFLSDWRTFVCKEDVLWLKRIICDVIYITVILLWKKKHNGRPQIVPCRLHHCLRVSVK